ncbi:MAG: hypothetical protein ACLS3C_09765 [Oscillospiraceae bacterium]
MQPEVILPFWTASFQTTESSSWILECSTRSSANRIQSELDYTGKVLVLSPNTLKEEYWSPENQLWLAQSGFGCSPTARGRSILCVCLGDGEQTRWNRNDFIGVLKDEYPAGLGKRETEAASAVRIRGKTANAAWRDVNLDRKMVKFIKEQYPPGTRVRLRFQ